MDSSPLTAYAQTYLLGKSAATRWLFAHKALRPGDRTHGRQLVHLMASVVQGPFRQPVAWRCGDPAGVERVGYRPGTAAEVVADALHGSQQQRPTGQWHSGSSAQYAARARTVEAGWAARASVASSTSARRHGARRWAWRSRGPRPLRCPAASPTLMCRALPFVPAIASRDGRARAGAGREGRSAAS